VKQRKPSGRTLCKAAKRLYAPKLDQIELFAIKQLGGKRDGAGRQVGEGSVTVRVPLGCLTDVQQLIADYKNLKTVTEIKAE
jgi:hypothetical protein